MVKHRAHKKIKYLIPLVLVAACMVKYTGPGPVGMSVTVDNAGTGGEIRIVRDRNYIAHILADNEEDLYFGVGFAMAQDRFPMMDMLRGAATGRLSEYLGNPVSFRGLSLPTMDILMRTFRFRESGVDGYAMMDPNERRLLEAFADGVNRYLVEIGDDQLMGYRKGQRPAWWTPEDSLAIFGLFGIIMTMNHLFEEYYLDLVGAQIGRERLRELLPGYPKDAPIIVGGAGADNMEATIEAMGALRDMLNEIIPHPIGSNSWAVSGKNTQSGKALLSNDPHVPLFQIPTFWYHCHLKGRGVDVAGLMFPGFPGFGAGRNGRIAWGLTNVMADYFDMFRERVNPSDPNLYLYKNHWETFQTVRGSVRIYGRKPRRFSYRRTRHGVVIETGLIGKFKVRTWEAYEVIALKFVDLYLNRVMEGYFQLARANDWNEFRQACKKISDGSVAWNMTYADEKGNIGYQMTGNIPMRDDNQGYIMHRGWTGEEEWQGYVPFDQLPYVYNPEKGYVFTANNRVEPDGYPYYISCTYMPYRAIRIGEYLAGLKNATAADMMALQADLVDSRARKLVPLILEDLESSGKADKYRDAIDALKEFEQNNYEARIDLTGPTVFNLFMYFLTDNVIEDEVGNIGGSAASYSLVVSEIIDDLFQHPESPWFDDVKTPEKESRADITLRTMDEAVKWMRHRLGHKPAKWVWGNAHKLTLVSPLSAYLYKLNRGRLSRGPFPYPGDSETVNAAGGLFINQVGYRVVEGPSSRMIVDFQNPDWFYAASSTGMAWNPDDPHFVNLTETWMKNEYDRMYMSDRGFMEANRGTVVIRT